MIYCFLGSVTMQIHLTLSTVKYVLQCGVDLCSWVTLDWPWISDFLISFSRVFYIGTCGENVIFTGVTDGCETWCKCWKSNLGILEEHPVLITWAISPAPDVNFLLFSSTVCNCRLMWDWTIQDVFAFCLQYGYFKSIIFLLTLTHILSPVTSSVPAEAGQGRLHPQLNFRHHWDATSYFFCWKQWYRC